MTTMMISIDGIARNVLHDLGSIPAFDGNGNLTHAARDVIKEHNDRLCHHERFDAIRNAARSGLRINRRKDESLKRTLFSLVQVRLTHIVRDPVRGAAS